MGLIQRQATQVSLVSYLGILLGYVNLIILFPKALEPEQLGLTRVLLAASLIFSQFAQLGITHITYKFFPFFKDRSKRHKGYLSFALLLPIAGMVLFTTVFFLLKPFILGIYQKKSQLFVDFYYYLFPLTLFMVYFEVLFAYSCSLLKTVVPSFIREVVLRTYQFAIILLYQFHLFSFELFLLLFVLGYLLLIIVLLAYLLYLNQLFLRPDFNYFTSQLKTEILEYGFYIFFAGVASLILYNIDILMIGMLAGLTDTAIYSVAFFIGIAIMVPAKSIFVSAFPIISNAWKNEDMKQIESIYKKTALNQLILGSFLLILIWANADNIMYFLPEKYSGGKYVILFVGLGKLFDMSTGIVGGIINTSKHYRFILLSNVLLIMVTVISNYFLIMSYGILGAAFATMISVITYNSLNTAFVFLKFKMQPFSRTTLKALLICGTTFAIAYYLPALHNVWLDIIMKSVILTIVFAVPILLMKVSEDVNHVFNVIIKKCWKF